MNAQDIINAARYESLVDLSNEETLVSNSIQSFDFKNVFLTLKQPSTLFLINIKPEWNIALIESIAEQKLVQLGYKVKKVGIGGFEIENPLKALLGL